MDSLGRAGGVAAISIAASVLIGKALTPTPSWRVTEEFVFVFVIEQDERSQLVEGLLRTEMRQVIMSAGPSTGLSRTGKEAEEAELRGGHEQLTR